MDFHAPLNHMVDAVYPESDAARHFRDFVQAYVQGGFTDRAAEQEIRAKLTAWRDNDAKLRALLEQSFLLQELTPLSQDLSALGAAGLEALDYLDKAEPSPEAWRTEQLARAEQAKTPKADLLLMVAAPVGQLIAATGPKQPGP